MRIWPADGSGDPIEYRDLGSTEIFGVSADGRHFVLASSYDGAVRVFSIDRITEPAVFSDVPAILAQMSPDGTKIAIVTRENAFPIRAAVVALSAKRGGDRAAVRRRQPAPPADPQGIS
jgi:hypothetical protein